MTDLIPTFSGEVMLAGWKETHTGGAVVSFFLPDPADLDVFRGLTVRKGGTAGHRFMAVLVEIQDDEKPAQTEDDKNRRAASALDRITGTKPFGKQASELYKAGFFFNPHVMAAVGSDQQYLEWLKTQPCCVNGPVIRTEIPGHTHFGDVVPAHVRRIAAGAGTSLKPEFSAVPMCDMHHKMQHQHGESVVGGKTFLDNQRARHLSRWMAQRVFNTASMGHVNPGEVTVWAVANNISHYLPESYG